MKVREVMTKQAEYIHSNTSLKEAAGKMKTFGTGFLPIGDSPEGKLKGVVTDRDIAIRAVGEGLDANSTSVDDVKSDRVLYCFADDDIKAAAKSMHDEKVYRLIVLDDANNKKLSGVISLGDIVRQGDINLGGETAQGIAS